MKLLRIRSQENLRLLREKVDRKGWGSSPPTIVNAFYNAARNQISNPMKNHERIEILHVSSRFSCWNSSNTILQQRCSKVNPLPRS